MREGGLAPFRGGVAAALLCVTPACSWGQAGNADAPSGPLPTAGSSPSAGSPATSNSSGAGGVSAVGGATEGGAPLTAGASSAGAKSSGGAGGVPSGNGGGSGGLGLGGSTSGAPVCGSAAEGESASLSCPPGEIISAVEFASYGTPTGSCGSFVAGACNSATSKSVIESQCLGKRSCSVVASNDNFGDPCNKTTKKLAISVSCVVGEATTPPTGTEPYKGLANSPAAQINALGATWCYNWGTTPKSTDCADPYFVPMVWGSGNVASAIQGIGNAAYKTVLGFNEPNKTDQANMTVAEAIALWPDLTSDSSIRVGSPAVSDDGRAWLEDFMDQAQQKGLRVDFVAMHWYGWNKGSCVASQLEGAVKWASQWGKPVWITEFGCMGSSNPDEKTVLDFFNGAIPMLAKHPLVERYAWYPWNTYNDVYTSGAMTALGQAFAAAPPYRP